MKTTRWIARNLASRGMSLGLAAIFPAFAWSAQSSVNYAVPVAAVDGGGRAAASADYQAQGSVGGIGGTSTVASPVITANSGYVAQIVGTPQTITFNSLPDTPFTVVPVTLVASASSGLPVGFSVITGFASVNGSTLTLGGAGGVTVRASQPGDDNYTPAPDVDQSFVVTPDFASWQVGHFNSGQLSNPALSGPTAVYGQDGLPNLVKYALGLAPGVNATTGLPVLTTDGTNWIYTFTRPVAASDVNVTVEFSTNLTGWSSAGVNLQKIGSDGTTDTYRATYPVASAPNAFFRLNVTLP